MVARTRLNVTLYVQYIACLVTTSLCPSTYQEDAHHFQQTQTPHSPRKASETKQEGETETGVVILKHE